jgi:tRNA 2-thiocytidine biosynthesis protein TtcA
MGAIFSKRLIKNFAKTVNEYNLIEEGDHIAVGFSGGKDSLTMLHLFDRFARISPKKFTFMAITIDYGNGQDFSYLREHCATYNIPLKIFDTNISEVAQDTIRENSSFCSYFSRMRRGALYRACEEMNFNKLALGHHLDDAVESFFMNMFYNGTMRSMPPIYMSKYNVAVIRPLITSREMQLEQFTTSNNFLTVGDEACPGMNMKVKLPFARAQIKEMLASLETTHSDMFTMIKSSFKHIHEETFFDSNKFKL